jgi:hypothetical protein
MPSDLLQRDTEASDVAESRRSKGLSQVSESLSALGPWSPPGNSGNFFIKCELPHTRMALAAASSPKIRDYSSEEVHALRPAPA